MSEFLPENYTSSGASGGPVDPTLSDSDIARIKKDFGNPNAVFQHAPQFFSYLVSYLEQSNLQLPIGQIFGASNSIAPLGSYRLVHPPATGIANEQVVDGQFLVCNGFAVSRTKYPSLFKLWNESTPVLPHGIGDGTTTFNLPDLRGRVPFGLAASGTFGTLGATGGSETAALDTVDSAPAGSGQNATFDSSVDIVPPFAVVGVWVVKF